MQPIQPVQSLSFITRIHTDKLECGHAAAAHVASLLKKILSEQDKARVIFACAPSQDSFLQALTDPQLHAIDWHRVEVFHMDDYVGLSGDHPQSFRAYLRKNLLEKVEPAAFHLIRGEAEDPAAECRRYAALLTAEPMDLVCCGIGENGHLAFNDPPVANFRDPEVIKVVELDDACRTQQVNDGCFPTFDDVPTHAYTLTIPTMTGCRHVSCVVPGPLKADAVKNTLEGPIERACPASILRLHPSTALFLDKDSTGKLAL